MKETSGSALNANAPNGKSPVALADIAVRKMLLERLLRVLRREKKALGAALFSDMTLPETEFLLYEYQPVIQTIRTLAAHLSGWTAESFFSGHAFRRRLCPRGAALIASGEWEPLASTLIPVIGAIAAGCPVMLALSSARQSTAMKIAEILQEAFPPEVVTCSNSDFSILLKQDFQVIYPGCNAVNLRLAKDCAAHRVHCTIIEEPQDVVPVIVDESAALRSAARCIVRGKFRAAGQLRYAPDFVLVHHKVKERFLVEVRKAIRRFYGENPQKSGDYARIAGRTHYETLCALMSEGNLAAGGEYAPDELFIAPTVIEGADREGALMKQPTRGPVLPVFEYETFYSAMAYIRSRTVPPVVYFFGHSRRKQRRLHETLAMPVMSVNDIPPRPLWASYGGVRDLLEAFSLPGGYAGSGCGYGFYHPPFSHWKLRLLHFFCK